MNPDYVRELQNSLTSITDKLRIDLQGVRSNRPSVEMVENIQVSAYDQVLPIKQLGALGISPPRDILITPWDKNISGAIVKAIEDAHVGLSVSSDGAVIRASLSQLGNERRDELVKLVKKTGEEARIMIRGRRDDAMKRIKAAQDAKELSEDQAFRMKDQAQKAVEEANKRVEELSGKKLEELGE